MLSLHLSFLFMGWWLPSLLQLENRDSPEAQSVPWEVTRLSSSCLPPSVFSSPLVFPHIPSFFSSIFSFPLSVPLSFCPSQIFNFYSGVLSFILLLYFLSLFGFGVSSLSTGHRKERGREWFLCLGDASWQHSFYWRREADDATYAKGAIPVWLRKATVAWLHTSWWDLP